MYALEQAIVNSVHETWYKTKEELKAVVFSEFATKKDLEHVRTQLIGKIETLYENTEKDKAELLGKMEKDKAELLGKIEAVYEKTEKDKAELFGVMKQDKAELLLKMEQLNRKFSMYFITLHLL